VLTERPLPSTTEGDLGKEAITRLLAPDPETAIDQALALAEVIGGG